MCAVMLNPLIAYGLDSAVVACHLLYSLQRVADALRDPEHATDLNKYVERIAELSRSLLEDEPEKMAVQARASAILATLSRVSRTKRRSEGV